MGDGIGPEISKGVQDVFEAARVEIDWDVQEVTPELGVSQKVIDSVHKNKLGLKGPLGTPIGKGHRSLNLALRQEFDLYANVRPARTVPGARSWYSDVDCVIIRENTEGEYSGLEHMVKPGVAESIKVISYEASKRIAHYAFDYARKHNRKKVTSVHLAHVQAKADGLFIQTCAEVAAQYPDIEYAEKTLANVCMGLAADPTKFDVMVLPNLYGDVVSDMCAGLLGGLGLTPSGNIGTDTAIFEAVHGTAPDIAGKDLANPTALLLSAVMMLRHMGEIEKANIIHQSVLNVIQEGKVITGDLGGSSKCSEYVMRLQEEVHKLAEF
eukprot:TRINITY_DN17_c0_g1_i1.p1 TRINITY_DN17_c0_g1~~TRINITY_DN17_c0_g1_i1.p1  ORF type:complete len:368 (+),score=69.00 TRINITY_DN17_c0_g1_i1:131-1105(+)